MCSNQRCPGQQCSLCCSATLVSTNISTSILTFRCYMFSEAITETHCAVFRGTVVTQECVEKLIKKDMIDPVTGDQLSDKDIIPLQRVRIFLCRGRSFQLSRSLWFEIVSLIPKILSCTLDLTISQLRRQTEGAFRQQAVAATTSIVTDVVDTMETEGAVNYCFSSC